METLWFVLVAFMLVAYAALDGFDIGVGIIHHFVARNEDEKSLALRSIGPVWDGNEVWLIATGGALFFAFPKLYASSFSGFYLPLMIVLWLLMLRGMGIELRSHIDDPLWRSFFDFLFAFASILLAIFYGAAVGNVVRGVPLNAEGYFFEALWTNFRVSTDPGILDWYTALIGLLSFVTLAVHGANYLLVKTEGDLQMRARSLALKGWAVLVLLTALSLAATLYVRPQVLDNFEQHVWGWTIPLTVVCALALMRYFYARRRDVAAFLSSVVYIAAMLGGAAFAMHPYLLPATTEPTYGLTIYNSQTGAYSLAVGLVWWLAGVTLAIGYFTFVYRSFRGKVRLGDAH